MAEVSFTYALKRFFPDISTQSVEAEDVSTLLKKLNDHYPGLLGYIVNDQGMLRKHVNIFIDGNLVRDRTALSDPLESGSEVYIMQALSGG